jgi:hypothetical protein
MNMFRKNIIASAAALAVTLLAASQVQAYGACHAGYTHVGPNGVQHVGYSGASGPYGAGGSVHETSVGPGGTYHAAYGGATTTGGSAYGGYHTYTPSVSGGYAAGGYHYGTTTGGGTAYSAGVYRGY